MDPIPKLHQGRVAPDQTPPNPGTRFPRMRGPHRVTMPWRKLEAEGLHSVIPTPGQTAVQMKPATGSATLAAGKASACRTAHIA